MSSCCTVPVMPEIAFSFPMSLPCNTGDLREICVFFTLQIENALHQSKHLNVGSSRSYLIIFYFVQKCKSFHPPRTLFSPKLRKICEKTMIISRMPMRHKKTASVICSYTQKCRPSGAYLGFSNRDRDKKKARGYPLAFAFPFELLSLLQGVSGTQRSSAFSESASKAALLTFLGSL